jgi:hypothetical protein
MVKQRIFGLHKKASGAVLAARRETNAYVPVILNDTGDLPRVVLVEDPRQPNHRDNAEMRRNIGGDMSRRVQLPNFSCYS